MSGQPGLYQLVIMLAGGPALIILGAVLRERRRRVLRRARTTTGTVIGGELRKIEDGCQPVVRYRYRVDGQDRIGTRVTPPPGAETIMMCHRAQRLVDAYPAGTQVTVHFLPDAPETAFLRRGGNWFWMIPAGLGAALLVIAWQRLSGA